ncbi:MAG: asparagine synthase (glutamine-hydrolyzing) [Planctomycetaceae bacterium]
MCGICGHLTLPGEPRTSSAVVDRMVRALFHRGPDDHAVYRHGRLTLGHARLSVIDLEGGGQPLFSEDRQVVVVCNGKIYNYRELREEMRLRGHCLATDSDSEVVVHLWEEFGPEFVDRLRGMFALAVFDNRSGSLFLARDAFGQKPLFYHQGTRELAFASEIGSLLEIPGITRDLDRRALDQFLFYQYVPQPRTMFQAIRQLPAGHCLLHRRDETRIWRWSGADPLPVSGEGDERCIEGLEAALEDAIESHLVSDVPVGVFLSGGLDSSLVLAAASRKSNEPLQTFSIAFPGTAADESQHARRAAQAFGSRHTQITFDAGRVREYLETVGRVYGQPLADSATMPVLALSEVASQHVKVVLTGDGGDELFGGYRRYRRAVGALGRNPLLTFAGPRWFSTRRLARCGSDPLRLRRLQSRVGMLVAPANRSSYQQQSWEGWDRCELYQDELVDELSSEFEVPMTESSGALDSLPAISRMLRLDQGHYLPDDLLLKTDRATMAFGLEARAPLLDSRLAEHAASLPVHLKVTPRQSKVALRAIAEKWLPSELASRQKQGFSFPIGEWIRGPLHSWCRQMLLDESTSVPLLFRQEHVERVFEEHVSGRRNHSGRIYSLLAFELWHRNFAA